MEGKSLYAKGKGDRDPLTTDTPKPGRMGCWHGRSKDYVSVMCFLSPQLPLDGSNRNHQTPQLCGEAMQGEGEALNPILVMIPSSDQPSQRGMLLWVSLP